MNSRLKPFLVTFLFLFLVMHVAFGQALSLKECLQRAVQSSFVLKAAQQQMRVKEKQAAMAKAKNLPQLFGLLDVERHRLQAYGFYQQSSLLQADWALGGFLLKTDAVQQKEVQAAQKNQQALRLQVEGQVLQLFFDALKQEKIGALLKERLHRLQLHRQVAEALWQAGSKTQLDVLQTEARLLQLKEEIERAFNQQQKVLNELALLIDWPAGKSLELKPVAAESLTQNPLPGLEESALRNHPLLQMLRLKQQAVGLRRKLVRAEQWPRLQLNGGFVLDRDPTGDGDYWLTTIGVSLPVFQWNATGLALQKLNAERLQLQNQQSARQRRLNIEAQKLRIEMQHLQQILQLQSARLQKNEQALELARANYKAGLITNLEFLAVQEQHSRAQIDLQTTQLDFAQRLAQFYLLTNQDEQLEQW